MRPLQTILENAARSDRKIVLSEGADPRVVAATRAAREAQAARLILVGATDEIVEAFGGDLPDGVEIYDPENAPQRAELANAYHELRAHKGMTAEKAEKAMTDPVTAAAMLVRAGYAHGTLGGAVAATADIARAALQIIGTAPSAKMVSSFFLMLLCKDHHARKGAVVFSDAGLVVDPDAAGMAEIALSSSRSFSALTGQTPRVAMLSFSTKGSARHPNVSKVTEATALAKAAAPELMIDGELQFDAAFVPSVAARKAPDSALQGEANVFVFPNLDAGNIAYKIAQRIGGAVAIGPIFQGLSMPANDLSRGCDAEDILHMIAVTAAQVDPDVSECRAL
ncbi:phosphate acetyltransferase [Pontivivens insulae]|uniref:Phosphate acetyltransferase n=1 Tax=Pontivivens insulae TaxID=1639689 RepID=A0A2R8A8B4_9RHOB|nr:phosphate acetyltransferase [Pontivivens insulae]RED18575.1 phosphate acetyltransferase [Pontivivens insulae]SPF28473.1 Phosphate acetyltransferase [Pontivivens insulae]